MFSLEQNYNNRIIHEVETTDPLLFCLQDPQNSHIYSYYQYITTNYWEEDGLYVIKPIAEIYLRKIRSGNRNIFSGVSLYAVDDSGKF